QEYTGWMDF
uniref:Phyllocaerulein n=1 Tax=Phyllomedusa sauvagei TaxID=8395 RepID=CAER_PHYSA|nr:RecName: Full=Phyllocaerulein [Phyllomedusa sauvagii]